MLWAKFFRIRQNLVGSLWFFPLLGLVVGVLLALVVRELDAVITLPSAWENSSRSWLRSPECWPDLWWP